MLRTIGWILWFFAYMLCRIPRIWMAKNKSEAEYRAIIDKEVAVWAGKLLRNVKTYVTVEGKENLPAPGETVVYVANHQSYLDIPIVLAEIWPPPPILAKRELGKVPLLGYCMRLLGCVFVERDDARSGMEALRKAQETVENGRSMVVFPEGTRSKSDEMTKFQGGAVRLALKAGVPVIPVVIDGSYKGLEGNGFRLQKSDVRMVILPRVETKNLDKAQQRELPQVLEQMIKAKKDSVEK